MNMFEENNLTQQRRMAIYESVQENFIHFFADPLPSLYVFLPKDVQVMVSIMSITRSLQYSKYHQLYVETFKETSKPLHAQTVTKHIERLSKQIYEFKINSSRIIFAGEILEQYKRASQE